MKTLQNQDRKCLKCNCTLPIANFQYRVGTRNIIKSVCKGCSFEWKTHEVIAEAYGKWLERKKIINEDYYDEFSNSSISSSRSSSNY